MQETAIIIELSENQLELIKKALRNNQLSVDTQLRFSVIYYASQNWSNSKIARTSGLSRPSVIKWRKRWRECQLDLQYFEKGILSKRDFKAQLFSKMREIISDAPRSGAPSTISLAQIQQLRLMSCQKPSEYGLPHDKWSGALLARTAIERGIVNQISSRYVNKLLKKTSFILIKSLTG